MEGLENANLALVVGVAEFDFGDGQVAGLGLGNNVLGERVTEAIEVRFA